MTRRLERTVVLVAKERSGLVASVASNDVRIAEVRIRAQDAGGDFFLIVDQVITAKNLSRRFPDDLSHDAFSDLLRRDFPDRRPDGPEDAAGRKGRVTTNADPSPAPALSARTVPPCSFTICDTIESPMPSPGRWPRVSSA